MKTNNNEGATCAANANTTDNIITSKTTSETPAYSCFNGCVGTFAKYTNKKGGVMFGMIDSIFNGGRRVGFVHSEGETWTSELIWADDIAQCSNGDEIETAHESAVRYYENEAEHIRARIARHYEIDDEQKLAEMLAECEMWLEMLTRQSKEDTDESDEASGTK